MKGKARYKIVVVHLLPLLDVLLEAVAAEVPKSRVVDIFRLAMVSVLHDSRTAYIPGIYCLLGGYIIPTTYHQNQNNPLINFKMLNLVTLGPGAPLTPLNSCIRRGNHTGENVHWIECSNRETKCPLRNPPPFFLVYTSPIKAS